MGYLEPSWMCGLFVSMNRAPVTWMPPPRRPVPDSLMKVSWEAPSATKSPLGSQDPPQDRFGAGPQRTPILLFYFHLCHYQKETPAFPGQLSRTSLQSLSLSSSLSISKGWNQVPTSCRSVPRKSKAEPGHRGLTASAARLKVGVSHPCDFIYS